MIYGEVEMANIEGLQRTLEYIKEHPTEWDQMRWSTCFAGISLRVLRNAELSESNCCNLCRDVMIDGKRVGSVEIGDMARQILGLTHGQARDLFASGNELRHFEELIGEIVAEQVPA